MLPLHTDHTHCTHLHPARCEYIPQVGYVLVFTGQPTEDMLPADFDFQFCQKDEYMFKNGRMLDLDDEIGDIRGAIVDLSNGIVRQLEEMVLEHELDVCNACSGIAELDVLLSFAVCSADGDWARPALDDSNQLLISGGRHPLQEHTVDAFIRNDTFMGPCDGGYGGSDVDDSDRGADPGSSQRAIGLLDVVLS